VIALSDLAFIAGIDRDARQGSQSAQLTSGSVPGTVSDLEVKRFMDSAETVVTTLGDDAPHMHPRPLRDGALRARVSRFRTFGLPSPIADQPGDQAEQRAPSLQYGLGAGIVYCSNGGTV
jgi:hypothetical protein